MNKITKLINDKYPVHGSIASNQVTNIVARQAAHFGYGLGEVERKEQAETIEVLKEHVLQLYEVIIPRLTDKELSELREKLRSLPTTPHT